MLRDTFRCPHLKTKGWDTCLLGLFCRRWQIRQLVLHPGTKGHQKLRMTDTPSSALSPADSLDKNRHPRNGTNTALQMGNLATGAGSYPRAPQLNSMDAQQLHHVSRQWPQLTLPRAGLEKESPGTRAGGYGLDCHVNSNAS